jgi:hypothetical protein
MRSHRRGVSPLFGVLACVLSWSVAPIAGAAVTPEQERRLEVPVTPKVPPRAAGATNPEETMGCRRLPSSRPVVKLNLKPETDIVDLVAWISSITCRQFLVPGTVLANTKKVTVYAPQLITPEDAYRLFLSALDSVGLTVQESGRFLRIIETSKGRNSALPLDGFAGELLSNASDQESSQRQAPAAKPSASAVAR